MACDRCNYFLFWVIFCPFTPLIAQKTKIFKKWKKGLEISSFYTSAPKIMIICYTVPETWCVTGVIVIFHFGLFFALLPPNFPQKRKFQKKKNKKKMNKNTWRHHHFTEVYIQKIMIMWYTVAEIWCVTDAIVVFHFGLLFAFLPP